MLCMFVTLEVSQSNGWLKFTAFCREGRKQGTRCGAGCGPGGGRRHAVLGCARSVPGKGHVTADWGGMARREQRTQNMPFMLFTREVTQSSGWLKAYAPCRGSQTGHTVRGGLCGPGGGRRRAIPGRARSVPRGKGT